MTYAHLRSRVPLLLVFILAIASYAQDAPKNYSSTVVFMTDFGVVDDSVAICRGVMYSIDPELRIVDGAQQCVTEAGGARSYRREWNAAARRRP